MDDDLPPRQILLIDNYDSYTYNLYQYIAIATGVAPVVLKNVDQRGLSKDYLSQFAGVVISPGPGNPNVEADVGISKTVCCDLFEGPVLGVCLGFQGLALWEGCDIIKAPIAIHGELSEIQHEGRDPIFKDIPKSFKVVRYHSLIVCPKSISSSIDVLATTQVDDLIIPMALKLRHKPHWGVQYHPESICTDFGQQLVSNFVSICGIDTVQAPMINSFPCQISVKQPLARRTISFESLKLDPKIGVMGVYRGLFSDSKNVVWLDSSDPRGRYGIMAEHSDEFPESFYVKYSVDSGILGGEQLPQEFTSTGPILTTLERYLQKIRSTGFQCSVKEELPFQGGFLGYVGYELRGECSEATHCVSPIDLGPVDTALDMPDLFMIYTERFIVIDHHNDLLHVCCVSTPDDRTAKERWSEQTISTLSNLQPYVPTEATPVQEVVKFIPSKTKKEYISDIQQSQHLIKQGETYEVCLTNQFQAEASITDTLTFYEKLRQINASPYAAYIKVEGHGSVCSSSPERFLKIEQSGMCEAKPIKGTIKRSTDSVEDEKLKTELKNSKKDQCENLMIVDLLRNDLSILSEVGSVKVPKLMDIESYKTVHQMVTTVRSRISAETSVVQVLTSTFPGGSIVGAPKTRTMDFIQQLENRRRGIYTGSIGYLSLSNSMDFNIAIRTAVISTSHTGQPVIRIGAGGAITTLSDPEGEWDEIMIKAYPVMRTVSKIITGSEQNYSVALE